MHGGLDTATALAVLAAMVILVLEKFGVLERLNLIRPTATLAADELEIAYRKIRRLEGDLEQLRAERVRLQQEALEPVLELMRQNAEVGGQILERLVHHNGSFAHMEAALGLVAEGMKALTGTIAELHGIPLNPQRRDR